MSKIQKINSCIECNRQTECDFAFTSSIPPDCPLPDSDAWKKKVISLLDSEIATIKNELHTCDMYSTQVHHAEIEIRENLKQKIKGM